MGEAHYTQSSFVAGTLSPRVSARSDIEQYYAAGTIIENFVVLPHGPIARRSGSQFMGAVRNESRPSVLKSFTFNRTQSYMLVFNDGVIRFYSTNGYFLNDADTILEVAHDIPDEILKEVRFTQLNDLVIITHPKLAPKKLARHSATNWVFETIAFTAKPGEWTTDNYPSVSAFFEQRLYFAGCPSVPQKLWGSMTADFFNFTLNTSAAGSENPDLPLDRDAIAYSISSDRSSEILWLMAKDKLIAGTVGREFLLTSSAIGEALSPLNIRCACITTYGSKNVPPNILDDTMFFVQRGGQKIRAMAYQFTSDSYSARDISIMASHLVEDGIKKIGFQSSPDALMWVLTETNKVVSVTYESEHKVIAWHTHNVGDVKDLEVLDGVAYDTVWMIVEREVDGVKHQYIEFIRHAFKDSDDVKEQYFTDCTNIYKGDPTTVITGLDYLEGEEVTVLVDGWVHPTRVVEGGKITLQSPGSIVLVGLPFTSRFVSVRLTTPDAPMFYHIKNASQGILTVINSVGMKMGVAGQPLTQAINPTVRRMNEEVALVNGDLEVNFSSMADRELKIEIVQELPLPCTVAGFAVKVGANAL